MTLQPELSVLIAVRNEAQHLTSTLEGLCSQLDSGVVFETLIIDGMSTDETAQVVYRFERRLPRLRLLYNPKVLAAAGWNLGLREAQARRVAILSGHAHLPPGYFKTLLTALTTERVGVGGVAVPVGVDNTSCLVAKAFSCRLGNGGAPFMKNSKAGPVETVAFGCYWRQALLDVGGFDEQVVRGQDWDLNMRLRKAGGTLWLEPSVYVEYTTRADFVSLWWRQYLAGYWKYFIHRKNQVPLLLRHWIPGLFAASLTLSTLSMVWQVELASISVLILLTHLLATILQYHKLNSPASDLWRFWWILFLIHFAYGLGLLLGLLRPPPTHP
jgi:succinoglycan biosynthesis protein ExoA